MRLYNADDAKLKTAYRKLAMRWHPDKNKGSKDAEKKVVTLSSLHALHAPDNITRAGPLPSIPFPIPDSFRGVQGSQIDI